MKFHLQLSAGIALGQLCVTGPATSAELPWQDAGLSELEAAAFVLDRLTYGARPGDVDQVLEIGIEQWLAEQLAGDDPEAELEVRLADYEALGMSHADLGRRYPGGLQMSAHLRRFHPGLIPGRGELVLDFSVVRAKVNEFREANGFLFQELELRAQLVNQKVDRAVYAENQLREVLTDFWQNHFFTSPASFRARLWVLSFEGEAIRPNALGDFRTLLGAVSKHPAMRSYYAGNEQPSELAPGDSTFDMVVAEKAAEPGAATIAEALRARAESEVVALEYDEDLVLSREFWARTGPNPSYADALTRLQTLGPDANLSDADLLGVARAFTGWSTMPVGPSEGWYERGFKDALEVGFVLEDNFLFRADQHDGRPKSVLGLQLPAAGGVAEGERVLDILAAHEDTARHIARKLAVRFVAEEPDASLVERLALSFEDSGGDIAEVMLALVESPEFWAAARERDKVKTPLEYVASALRSVEAEVESPDAVVEWLTRMGQPLYTYLVATGFPDKGSFWLDSSAIVQRMNFAQRLLANEIEGVEVPSPAATPDIETLAATVLPGRDLDDTIKTLGEAYASAGAWRDGQAEITAMLIASPQFQLR